MEMKTSTATDVMTISSQLAEELFTEHGEDDAGFWRFRHVEHVGEWRWGAEYLFVLERLDDQTFWGCIIKEGSGDEPCGTFAYGHDTNLHLKQYTRESVPTWRYTRIV